MIELIKLMVDSKQKPRVIDAYCGRFNYKARKKEGETKPAFTKRMIAMQIKIVAKAWERQKDLEAADKKKVELIVE